MSSIEQWKLSYQVSPIFLTGPPVSNVPNGMLPFLSIVDPGAFPVSSNEAYAYSSTSGTAPQLYDLSSVSLNQGMLDNAFGAFNVLAGGSLIQQTVAKYPFANQPVTLQQVTAIGDSRHPDGSSWSLQCTGLVTNSAMMANSVAGSVITPAIQMGLGQAPSLTPPERRRAVRRYAV